MKILDRLPYYGHRTQVRVLEEWRFPLPTAVIVPIAKPLYLCDGTIGFPGGKTDLVGLFNSIKAASFPHAAKDFVVFAQLSNGLGQVPFYIDIRFAPTNHLIFTSNVHQTRFPNRHMTVQIAYTVPSCKFPQAGLYLVELYCNNQWVADTTLLLC